MLGFKALNKKKLGTQLGKKATHNTENTIIKPPRKKVMIKTK